MNKFRESAYRILGMLSVLEQNGVGLAVLLNYYHIREVLHEAQYILNEVPDGNRVVKICFTQNTFQHMNGAKIKISTPQNTVQDTRGRVLQNYWLDETCDWIASPWVLFYQG